MAEVLCAGDLLARAGYALRLYRRGGRPLPAGVDGPWDWPPHRRLASLSSHALSAVTITPAWGVTAAPGAREPLGRPGPWAEEATEIEQLYGPDRTVHVSLEEFARTLTAWEETVERLREGGVRSREIPRRLAHAVAAGEVDAYRRAFRRFRALDRPNVLALFATFRYDRRFAREYPEAVQVGPLWPAREPAAPARRHDRWLWYASPASSERLAPAVVEGLRRTAQNPGLVVRSPRPWKNLGPLPGVELRTDPLPPGAWRKAFVAAGLRIVTGSRSLLEALELGGPFLYFNGLLGEGPASRRHRPEKIVRLLAVARRAGWPDDLLADLRDFSRGRRVEDVVRRAGDRRGGWACFPRRPPAEGFAPGFEDAGRFVVRLVRELARGSTSASELVASTRRASHS